MLQIHFGAKTLSSALFNSWPHLHGSRGQVDKMDSKIDQILGALKGGGFRIPDPEEDVTPTPATHAILTVLKAGRCARHSI